MEGMLILLAIVTGLVAFDALALRFGVDSRPGFDDPASPTPGIEA